MVSTYLVHQGFCATAEAFISQTDQSFEEEIASIKNRQSIYEFLKMSLKNKNKYLSFYCVCRNIKTSINWSNGRSYWNDQ